MSAFKEAGHLFRFAGLFVLAFLVFLVVRHYVVPKSFGEYGHYRAAAIGEIATRPVKFAGHQTCEACHTDIAGQEEGRQARARELRSLPRGRWPTSSRTIPSTVRACAARHSACLRALPHGQRRQA